LWSIQYLWVWMPVKLLFFLQAIQSVVTLFVVSRHWLWNKEKTLYGDNVHPCCDIVLVTKLLVRFLWEFVTWKAYFIYMRKLNFSCVFYNFQVWIQFSTVDVCKSLLIVSSLKIGAILSQPTVINYPIEWVTDHSQLRPE
jgi:hypothetical protein